MPIWNAIKMLPLHSDEIMCFKALITIHKLLCSGPSLVLKEAINQINFFDQCQHSAHNSYLGYSVLIQKYSVYLKNKLEFHRIHPEFSGSFDYQEYVSLKRTNDPNEGYQTISELMELQDKLDLFQKEVFTTFRPSQNNECRISSLVPLIEESYGIYKFLTSMLTVMYTSVDSNSVDALEPLRERYVKQFQNLKRFYQECRNMRYLTSLVSIPDLPNEPSFGTNNAMVKSSSHHSLAKSPSNQQLVTTTETNLYAWSSQQSMQESQINELRQQAAIYKMQFEQAQNGLMQYQMHYQSMENEMNMMRQHVMNQDQLIQSLQEQVTMWKNKFETMAKMYQNLRQEHLEILQKQKSAMAAVGSKVELDKAKEQLKTLQHELMVASNEKMQFKSELNRITQSHGEEMTRMKRELAESRSRVEDMAKVKYVSFFLFLSKGSEYQAMVQKYEQERKALEESLSSKTSKVNELQQQLDHLLSDQGQKYKDQEEEMNILRTGLDQTLLAMNQVQQGSLEQEKKLLSKIDQITIENETKMQQLIANIYEQCRKKMDTSIAMLKDPTNSGNPLATVDYAAAVGEKTVHAINEFTLLKGDNIISKVNQALELAAVVDQSFLNFKGILRFSDNDEQSDKLVVNCIAAAEGVKDLYVQCSSSDGNAQGQSLGETFKNLISLSEMFNAKEVSAVTANDDIGSVLEHEMNSAAKAIQDAVARLDSLKKAPSTASTLQKSVHEAILDASLAIMNAIGRLIQYATVSQKEIVAQGKGSASPSQFYKKNSRWTEGLISAAKAVAISTNFLVDAADGVIKGTHSMEQLIVASHEVASSTAQLVAAARVKSSANSATQNSLELASKAVMDATKALVRSAKSISDQEKEADSIEQTLQGISLHEFKVLEMNQQVEILTLEKKLANARRQLSEMRKKEYLK